MNMERMKRAIISAFVKAGKKNRRLGCILMAGILFAAQTDLPRVFAETGQEANAAEGTSVDTALSGDEDTTADTVLITGFEALPDEIAKQTVALGTPYEELVLPEALTVYVGHKTDHSGENGEEDDAEDNGSTEEEEPGDNDSTEEEEPGDNDNTEEDKPHDDGSTGEGAAEDNSGESGDKTGDDDNFDGDNTEDNSGEAGQGNNGVEGDGNTVEAVQYEAHTSTVTMPEYQSENIIKVETLEQNTEMSGESGQTTIVILGITWESAPTYDSDTQGEYIFTPVLPEGYVIAGEGITFPTIIVTVEKGRTVRRMTAAGMLRAGGHSHPLCGMNCTHSHASQNYTALNRTGGSLSAGSYYLEADLEFTTAMEISGTVNLCLNGHSIYSEVSNGVIRVHNNSVLNICDCRSGGKIYCQKGHNPLQLSSGGTLNLYGGTIESGGATAIPVGTGSSDSSGGCTINIYGGTVSGKGQAILVNPSMSGTTINVYGGSVTAENYGIRAQNGSVNLAGGNVTATSNTGMGVSAENNTGVTLSGNAAVSGTAADISTALPIQDNGYTGGNVSIKVTNTALFVVNTILVRNGAVNSGKYSLVKEHTDNGWGLLKGGSGGLDLVLHTHLSHTYAAPVWSWTGYTSAKAEFTCTVSGCGYGETVTTAAGGITSAVTKEATCTEKGSKTYTATVVFEGKTYTDTKTEEISIKPFTVAFDANGGTGSMGSQTFTYGTAQALSTNQFIKNGYTFNGWNTKKTGGGDAFADGTSLVNYAPANGSSVTLYAQWKICKYKVTYNYSANGGSSATKTTADVNYGAAISLSPTAEKEGWEFVGWNTDQNAHEGLATLTMGNAAVTLYAIYKKPLTATFYSGSAGLAQTVTTTIYNKAAAGSVRAPEMKAWAEAKESGYTADRWSSGQFSGNTYYAGDSISISENKSYYGIYKKMITVTYDANGGKGNVDSQTTTRRASVHQTVVYRTDSVTLNDGTALSREGYTFGGWRQGSTNGSVVSGSHVNPDADITYYAKWDLINYKITYILDGGEVVGNPDNYSVESDTIMLVNPTKEGFTFIGWSGTGLNGDKNMTVMIPAGSTGNREYTAHWKAESYTVTLHGNGGSGTALTGYTYGTGAALPANWTRTGYMFAGWYENEECTGTAAVHISDTDKGNREYWAKWNPKQYTVTFDYQGATGGDGTPSIQVIYDSTYGSLPQPEKDGYAFQGWYTQADGQGEPVTGTTQVKADSDHVLYACWMDSEAPEAPALTDGVALPADWTNAQNMIPLVLTDNVSVTKLWVKVDDGDFALVDGFGGDGVSTQYSYIISEGNHTYTFKTADAAGNESGITAFTVKLDTAKPVIGPLSYENKATTLWQWIIGKKSMVIYVPVTEDGSGVTQISYAMTPAAADGSYDDSRKEEKTAPVVDGQAEIMFPQDEAYQGFRGRIVITCSDLAGNAADSVTVGMAEGATGVLVEDTAPAITAMADRAPSDTTVAQPGGTAISGDYYETAPALLVTVSDDTANQITAGIASVTYQVGDTPVQSVAVGTDSMQSGLQFTIPSSEIPVGVTVIRVMAQDHAGNKATETYTVKVKGPERRPAAVTDYRAEKLTGLIPNAEYRINGSVYTADAVGSVEIDETWMGTTLAVVKCGNGSETLDSEAQSLAVPTRPHTPAPAAQDEAGPNRKDGKLTGLTGNTTYEISIDGGRTWESRTADANGEITGLAPGSYTVRVAATDISFASCASGSAAEIKAYRIRVLFMANGEEYTSIYTSYGESITEIPEVPAKKDAGERLYEGMWCDAQGNPAVFTDVEADMTVYAVYTALYTVTLQEGAGYTLTVAADSSSPVKEGGSYSFTFALNKGYRTNAKFAIKVNGIVMELTADGSCIIDDIREDKTVTVEGVVKKTSGGGSSGDNEQPGGGNPSGDSGQPDGGNPSGDNSQSGGGNPSGGNNPPGEENSLTDTNPTRTGTPPSDRTSSEHGGSDGTPPADTDPGVTLEDTDGEIGGVAEHEEEQGTTPTDIESLINTELSADGENVQIVSAAIEGGRIVLPGENTKDGGSIATGNVSGMPGTSTVLKLGEGAVIVKVICTEQDCSAGVEDTAAVANAVLTQTHMELVSNGEVIEIRIDVKDISSQVPEQDKEVIESGMEAWHEEIPGLKLGMYVDISMFIRTGQEDWQAVTETEEPVAAVLGIPSRLQEDGREYYIIRAHEGEYALMNDTDDEPGTITISTDKFSSYAIAWQETGSAGGRCGLCHICPTFLGICCFVWLVMIAAVVFVVWMVMLRRRKKTDNAA